MKLKLQYKLYMLYKISFHDEHFIDNFIEAVPMSVNLWTLVQQNQKGENTVRVYFDWTEPPLWMLFKETFDEVG